MKIVNAEVFVTCPGRNFVTLKITTDDGLVGWADRQHGALGVMLDDLFAGLLAAGVLGVARYALG